MIEYFDDVLEIHIAQLIDESVHNGTHPWHWNYKANMKIPSRHWHTLAGHDIDEMTKNGYDYLIPLWETIDLKYPNLKIKRCYLNAHTPGVEPSIHQDDGEVTLIYYPKMNWDVNFGGGTTIYDKNLDKGTLINYKGNRLICFTASLPHQAMPVSRICHDLRTCIVFKTTKVNE
tara:strand:- start:2510 stop:3031 length:522 start_codon:yes stop_codon:yes gene_type:complete